MRPIWIVLLILLLLSPAQAQETDSWALVAGGFSFVTAIAQAPGDADRLFIADLNGTIHVVETGQLLPEPFLDLRETITTENYGQGLLGLTFHPDYVDNGFFYVTYTPEGNSPILARYHVLTGDPNHADPDSALIILQVDHASTLHNGGDIAFGPDGYLYWSIGDGAYKRSPAQNIRSHLGAMLRIDVDSDTPYAIPSDNPYLEVEDALPELWAKGLRNPWRFSFDRETGDLYIADVGEAQMEEINLQIADSAGGENYGWNWFEGTWLYLGGSQQGMTFPVVEYPHDNGSCSVTGGYVYRGEQFPILRGQYVFGDYCSGLIWTTQRRDDGNWFTRQLMDTRYLITTFGQDNAGELYLADARNGAVYRLASLP
jgi:glucose/arabinose dehydrogenase